MSVDRSAVAAALGNRPPSEPRPTCDSRPVHAPTVLSWAQPARIVPEGCADVNATLAEAGIRYDEHERRAHAVWLRHLLGLGCISIKRLCEALASPRPYLALHTLEIEGVTALCRQLESIVAAHAMGCGCDWYPCVLVDLLSVRESHEPILLFRIDEPYVFQVDSLNRVPARLARLVYESFHLVSFTLLPCMLPHELRRDHARFQIEDATPEFHLVRQAGGRRDIQRAARFVKSKEDWNRMSEFSSDPHELKQQLDYFTDVLYCQPPWMFDLKNEAPLHRARRLLQRLAQYEADMGPHPWVDYARHVCNTILVRFANERALEACCKRVFRHREREFEGGVSPYFSLILSSNGPVEAEHVKAIAQGLMDQGECAIEYYYLASMAPKHLREILEFRALALGLLARAHAVNEIATRRFSPRSPK